MDVQGNSATQGSVNEPNRRNTVSWDGRMKIETPGDLSEEGKLLKIVRTEG